MEKIHENMHVFMYMYFLHFSAYFSPHDIIAEKGPFYSPLLQGSNMDDEIDYVLSIMDELTKELIKEGWLGKYLH